MILSATPHLTNRAGITPSTVHLPHGNWATLVDFLLARFPAVPLTTWQARIAAREVVWQDAQGATWVVEVAMPYPGSGKLFYYRSVPNELPIPFTESIVFEDELLLVADKPHFLPVSPVGRYVQETLTVRLKQRFDLPELQPLHRIDRETAGLVVFAKQAQHRGAYQALFQTRQVTKTYAAIAAAPPVALHFPMLRQSHLRTAENFMQMEEVAGLPANAETLMSVAEQQGAWARYTLQPKTGLRHQLRAQMAALGLPLLYDTIYPTLQPEVDVPDFAHPLQLLAQQLSFTDPITGQARQFESGLALLPLEVVNSVE